MIKKIEYKLTKQPDSISEETFRPNENLVNFIESDDENNSRILVVQASNSSGKSFLLNSIAHSFNALKLPEDELSPTLRRSIKYLTDRDHQTIDFKINIDDPDGFHLESSYNSENGNEIIVNKENSSSVKIDNKSFSEKYKLLYDIPEKPLDRIYRLSKEVKDFNKDLLEKLNPLDQKLSKIIRAIKEERNEKIIEDLKNRTEENKRNLDSKKGSLDELNKRLNDLENQKILLKIKTAINKLEEKNIEYEKIKEELRNIKPPKKINNANKINDDIKKLKTSIKSIPIGNLITYLKNQFDDREFSHFFEEKLKSNEINILNYLYINREKIIDDLLENNDNIHKYRRTLISFKEISLVHIFNKIKKEFNENDFKLIKNLKATFDNFGDKKEKSVIIHEIFNSEIDDILEKLNKYEDKYSEIIKINSLQKDIEDTINKTVKEIEKGIKLAISLDKKISKKAGSNDSINYTKKTEKKESINDSIKIIKKEILLLKKNFEENGISHLDTDNNIALDNLIENLRLKNSYCKGIENEKIEELKSEVKKYSQINLDLEKKIKDDQFKFEHENSKIASDFSKNQREIQMLSNKISYFTKYLNQKNNLIDDTGELNDNKTEDDYSYMKIIGEFVASMMGNEIIYQENNVKIAYIDYTKNSPYFVTNENKRISFSDFSGGQGSSNYLKAKLNTNEKRKYIVLIDEIANMDQNSLDIVINRLKELDKMNKLLLAILVEPHKEKNRFEIKAH